MYLHFVPAPVQWLFSDFSWRKKKKGKKVIYLTFDDGPIPEATPMVLKVLEQFQAHATFFCVGDNVRKYPDIVRKVVEGGHSLGNHTFHHLNGFNCETSAYLENVQRCQQEFQQACGREPKLFRPPHGRIKKSQYSQLLPEYEIVMWDVLSADFDPQLLPEECLQKSIRHTRNGSIVVFHDSLKAFRNMSWVLPRYLKHFSALGYGFEAL